MDRIDKLRDRLQSMWDAPLRERAELWRAVYRDCPDFARDRMHRLAYDTRLGEVTGGEWIHVEDVTNPGEPALPNHPPLRVTASRPYRGYSLQIEIERDSSGGWAARGTVDDAGWRPIHHYALAGSASLEDAFRAGISVAVKFVDARMEQRQPPSKGIDPSLYILGEESD